MKLNTKMRYGTRAMLELAVHQDEGVRSLAEIAASQEISEKYLELLFASLRSAGLVISQRGARGGYLLAMPPEEITLREIYDTFESPEPYAPCVADPSRCDRAAACVTQSVWAEMYNVSMRVLEGVTLADLAARARGACQPAWAYEI